MQRINCVDKDIFESGADIIIHQVNCQGFMSTGVAEQVRLKYPEVYIAYKYKCFRSKKEDKSDLLGTIQAVYINDTQQIVNLFAQKNFGYDGRCYTDYKALRSCLRKVYHEFAGCTVAIPWLMGCHHGGGEWDTVRPMIEEILNGCLCTFYKSKGVKI